MGGCAVGDGAEPGSFPDLDMLCVGRMFCNDYTGSRLAPNELYSHVSMWALAASPLLLSCDLNRLDEFTQSLLRNDEVIDIDQDPLGKAVACIVEKGDYEVWSRPLADGSIAVGLYNKGPRETEVAFDMAAAGMEGEWKVRDCWRQKDEGTAKGVYKAKVYGHATHLVWFIPGKDAKQREQLLLPKGHDFKLVWHDEFDGDRLDEAVSHTEEFILLTTECNGGRNGTEKDHPELEDALAAGDAFIVDHVRVYDIVDGK